jgi:hypothetical protein
MARQSTLDYRCCFCKRDSSDVSEMCERCEDRRDRFASAALAALIQKGKCSYLQARKRAWEYADTMMLSDELRLPPPEWEEFIEHLEKSQRVLAGVYAAARVEWASEEVRVVVQSSCGLTSAIARDETNVGLLRAALGEFTGKPYHVRVFAVGGK